MIGAAIVASMLRPIYCWLVPEKYHPMVINVVFGGAVFAILALHILIRYFPYSPPTMAFREMVKP